jgi:hypothetical protein
MKRPIKTPPSKIKVGDYVEVTDLRDGTIIGKAEVKAINETDWFPGEGKRLTATLSLGFACGFPCLKKISKTRTGTREESLKFVQELGKHDAEAVKLPDGNTQALRVMFNNLTDLPLRNGDNCITVCAPWLLSDIFFV